MESGQGAVHEVLAAAISDARHPALRLSCFVGEALDDEDVLDDVDSVDDLAGSVPEDIRRRAELRRAALVVAAVQVVEQCLDDLQTLTFDDDGLPHGDQALQTLVFDAFPPQHRPAYNQRFFRAVLVTAVKVCHDLADPNGGPAACTAEEILRSHIGQQAVALCELAGLGEPWFDPDELLLEDTDFETLYDEAMDGLEDDPGHQAAINVEVPPVVDWFTPFNHHRIVHPAVRTESSRSAQLHDLRQRLADLTSSELDAIDWKSVDNPAPISGFAATSEVVSLARATVGRGGADAVWVPDQEHIEASFGDLVRMTSVSAGGSGWMTWEPHQGANTVRTDGVIMAVPHRHFPIGRDEPYVDVSLGAKLISVPLSALVSYKADPAPRRHWEEALSLHET